jgi:hypothetical protein
MTGDTPRGGTATEAPPSIPQAPQTEHLSTPAQYPEHPYPSPAVPYRYPPEQRPRVRGGSRWLAWVIGGTAATLVLAGVLIALLAALVGGFVFSTIGQNEQTASFTKTFVVSGTPSLVISDSAGNVTIQRGSGSQMTVQVTKHAWGSSVAVAQSGVALTAVDLSQSGNTITVNSQFSTSYFDGGMARRTVDVLVTVPAQANADVHLGAGNMDARQFTGAIRLDSGAGNVTTDNVTFAGTSRLNAGAGNITVAGVIARGATVDVHVGAGNATLTLPPDTPARLSASTGVGNLTIAGWPIQVTGTGFTGHSANGDLGANPTGTLTIQVGTGNVTLISR